MAKSVGIKIDGGQVIKMFNDFNGKDMKRAMHTAIQRSLVVVKKKAVSNLGQAVEPDKISFPDKYGNTLKKGIKTKVFRNKQSGIIHIKGNYKLRFFEGGTDDRYQEYNTRSPKVPLKKDRYTGKIKKYNFFSNALMQTEEQVFNNIHIELANAIKKIRDKNAK